MIDPNDESKLPAVQQSEYTLLRPGSGERRMERFRENLGPGGLTPLDLPRIKIPAGGDLFWTIKGLDGDEKTKRLEAIVLAWRPARLYWVRSLNEGGAKGPPDCTSKDGFVGVGDPGGNCLKCPKAQFGTSARGHGQACKQVRQMLLLLPGESVPHLLSIPPTSLKVASQYFLRLSSRDLDYWGVVTSLTLELAKSTDQQEYSRAIFSLGRVLTPAEARIMLPYHREMQQILEPLAVEDEGGEASRRNDPDPPFYAGPDPRNGPVSGTSTDPNDEIPF